MRGVEGVFAAFGKPGITWVHNILDTLVLPTLASLPVQAVAMCSNLYEARMIFFFFHFSEFPSLLGIKGMPGNCVGSKGDRPYGDNTTPPRDDCCTTRARTIRP